MSTDDGVYEFVGPINENGHTYYATIDLTRIHVAPYGLYPVKHNFVVVMSTSTFVLPSDNSSGNYVKSTHIAITDDLNTIHYNGRPFSVEHYILNGKKCELDKDSIPMDNTQLAIRFGDVVFEIGISDITRNSHQVDAMLTDRVIQIGEAVHKFLMEQQKIKDIIEKITNSV